MNAIVVGGGIGGLAAGIALQSIGIHVDVYEQSPEIKEVGAGLSLWANAIRALASLGIAEDVLQRGRIVKRGRTITAAGELISETDFLEICPSVPCLMILRSELQSALVESLSANRIHTRARCTDVQQCEDKVQVKFEDGSFHEADFVVGADGIHSIVRSRLFGRQRPRYSGFTCWRGIADFEADELRDGTSLLALGPGFQMGMIACGAGQVYWFLARRAPVDGKDHDQGAKQELLPLLQRFTPLLGACVNATENSRVMRNDLIDRPPVWPWGSGRVTLLGDAVHPTTPNLGQGACQAIEDSVFLADSVASGPVIEASLRRYERQRRRRTSFVTRQSFQSGKILGLKRPMLISLRNRVLSSKIGQRMSMRMFNKLLDYKMPNIGKRKGLDW